MLKESEEILRSGSRYQSIVVAVIIKSNYGSETVIPLYITSYKEKLYSESAIVAKRRRLSIHRPKSLFDEPLWYL